MEIKAEKLNQFFEQVKTMSFWRRIFGWSEFRVLSYEAYEEFKSLITLTGRASQDITAAKGTTTILENTNKHLEEKQLRQETELVTAKEKIGRLEQENSSLKEENIIFKQTENTQNKRFEQELANLTLLTTQTRNDRQEEIENRHAEELARQAGLKETWSKHEDNVQQAIKRICQKYIVEYVDKVPFKGSPDNTIKIADEFIIFDAKSPGSEDLGNFPTYIKVQTESVKKYIKEEAVKKDIFLVIPSDTVDVIDQFSFNMGDYNVYIITLDALEPIILSLKKLEEYEFIEQLSPDERDNIYRVIGRLAHITKRRVQIDMFLGRESLEILSKVDTDLPAEALEKVIGYERAEKLNPPIEKRSKSISIKELEAGETKIRKEAEAKEIASPSSIQIEL